MRYYYLLFLCFLGQTAYSQLNVVLTPADTTLCFHDSIAFVTKVSGNGTDTVTYQWQKNSVYISGKTDSVLTFPSVDVGDTATYRCIIKAGADSAISNDAFLRMHPKMKFDTLYRYNELGCRGVCKGQFKTLISGGLPPFTYNWGGGHSQDTIVFGLCPGKYWLFVTDSNQCSIDSSYFVDVLKSPKVIVTALPHDTVYLSNPTITISFPDTALKYITSWTWDFRDSVRIPNVNPATHTFLNPGNYPVKLQLTDINGCDTAIIHDITVKILNLFIPNVITPNGDNKNDQLFIKEKVSENNYKEIDLLEVYLSNELVIYDRWGKKVYNQTNYKSGDWDGGNLSDGFYYYVFKGIGQYGDDVFRGSITILRSSSSP
jgi:PKD repeat protein